MRYGFIGLGELGGALAASLIRRGFALRVHDIDERRMERLVGIARAKRLLGRPEPA